jgi:hypothetical protein
METGDVLSTRGEQQVKTECDVSQAVLLPQSATLWPLIAHCVEEKGKSSN